MMDFGCLGKRNDNVRLSFFDISSFSFSFVRSSIRQSDSVR
jgi:hypothetical protein